MSYYLGHFWQNVWKSQSTNKEMKALKMHRILSMAFSLDWYKKLNHISTPRIKIFLMLFRWKLKKYYQKEKCM